MVELWSHGILYKETCMHMLGLSFCLGARHVSSLYTLAPFSLSRFEVGQFYILGLGVRQYVRTHRTSSGTQERVITLNL